MKSLENRLMGGHPNSLGNTIEVVQDVLDNPGLFDELFNCYFSNDETVRLRTSNAMKRIGREQKQLLVPYIDRFLTDIAQIDQASTQWTLSQLFSILEGEMSDIQMARAKEIMMNNLENHQDWIVLNTTIETLTNWSNQDRGLKSWLRPNLERLKGDKRKSVSGKATKMLLQLGKE